MVLRLKLKRQQKRNLSKVTDLTFFFYIHHAVLLRSHSQEESGCLFWDSSYRLSSDKSLYYWVELLLILAITYQNNNGLSLFFIPLNTLWIHVTVHCFGHNTILILIFLSTLSIVRFLSTPISAELGENETI